MHPTPKPWRCAMRAIRRTTALVATAVLVPMLTAAGAARAATRAAWPAYQHAVRVEAARDARMAGLEHPRRALHPSQRAASPSIFDAPTDVQQIGEDALKGGEQDTQTEPDMAMDPNNPNDLVAVVQQGRFKT